MGWWAILGRWTSRFAGLGVVGIEERMVGACGFELRDPVPEGVLLIEVAYVRHIESDVSGDGKGE